MGSLHVACELCGVVETCHFTMLDIMSLDRVQKTDSVWSVDLVKLR